MGQGKSKETEKSKVYSSSKPPPASPLLIAAYGRLAEGARHVVRTGSGADSGLPDALSWEALCPLATLSWGRRAAWGSIASPEVAPKFPAGHQVALCSEFEQYAVFCVAHTPEQGSLCISVLFEIAATASSPPEFYSCLSRDAPRLFRISCDAFSVDGGESLYRHSSTQALSSRQMQSDASDAVHTMFIGSAGGFAIHAPHGSEEAKKAVLAISPDGGTVQVAVGGAEGDSGEGVHLVLRASSAGDEPSLLLEKPAAGACPGVIPPAGTSASALMGGAGASYMWPSLRVEAGQCWIRSGGIKTAIVGQNSTACAWHARSRSTPKSCPPFSQSTVWVVLNTSALRFARLHSTPCRGCHGGRLQGCVRDPKLSDGAFVTAQTHRVPGGRTALALLETGAMDGRVPLSAPRGAGLLEGIFQEYALDLMREDSAGSAGGWCIRLRSLDLRTVLAARLRAAGSAHADLLARSFACSSAWTAASGLRTVFPVRAIVFALVAYVLLFPSTTAARIALIFALLMLLLVGFEPCPPQLWPSNPLFGRGRANTPTFPY